MDGFTVNITLGRLRKFENSLGGGLIYKVQKCVEQANDSRTFDIFFAATGSGVLVPPEGTKLDDLQYNDVNEALKLLFDEIGKDLQGMRGKDTTAEAEGEDPKLQVPTTK